MPSLSASMNAIAFLTEMLLRAGISFATAQRDACRMEHAISEESFAKLRAAMDIKKEGLFILRYH